MDINVTIKCPDLPLSATTLADAIAKLTALAMLTPEADIKPEAVKAAMQATPAQIMAQQPAAAPAAPVQAPVAANSTPAGYSPATPAPTPQSAQTSAAVPVSPMSTPATIPPAVAMTAPTAPAAVPTSPAPEITGDMVAKAGADLIAANPAAMAQLNGLLQKYGVGCAQELRPDQIGPFATEMRALGAKI